MRQISERYQSFIDDFIFSYYSFFSTSYSNECYIIYQIVIVLDFVRRALSLQNLPPNQVMMGLALFITFFIMAPTIGKVNDDALQPYLNGKIDQSAFFEGSMKHLRDFMIRQLGKEGTKDVALFLKIGKVQNVKSFDDVPSYRLFQPLCYLKSKRRSLSVSISLSLLS